MTARRVLFLGNSYTAAPRIALRDDPGRWPDMRVSVLAMPGASLNTLVLEDGRLVARGDKARYDMEYYNDLTELPLQGFDAFNVHARLSLAGGALWPPAQIQSLQVSK